MKKRIVKAAAALMLGGLIASGAQAAPSDDLQEYRDYFAKKFPGVELQEYANGAYAIDPVMRANWEAIEEFPPYEPFIDEGKAMFEKPFANGKGYKDCFPNGGIGIADQYPRWDREQGQVVTLALAVNQCREANGEKPLKYFKGAIASLLAYMNYTSRGNLTNVEVPADDPRALDAYNDGKEFYYSRRGQLNFSCAHCHMDGAGRLVRTDRLSPAIGHTTGWPVYRSKWGEMGTLHRRFKGCNENIRAAPRSAQGPEYRNLEYFLSHMSNGIAMNGPSARK